MLLGNIKEIFPNFNINIKDNYLFINLYIDDIINYLKKELESKLKKVEFKKFGDGILIIIDVKENLLENLKTLSPNIEINPPILKIFIPFSDIVNGLNLPNNVQKDITIDEKQICIKVKLY